MYNFAFSSTSLPKFQHFARIASFCKPGKPPDKPGSYRNVFVSPTVSRVLDGVSANRMKILLDPQISSAQGGFRDNIGTLEHVFVLREIIISANRTDRPLILGFFDIKGAFDRVPIPELLFKLWNSGIQGKFWDFMEHAYSNMYAFFMQNNQIFVPTLSAGLRQGGKSSPILWNLFFNDLEKDLRNHNVSEYEFDPNFLPSLFFLLLLFADDLVLIGNSPEDLQEKIDILLNYAGKWGLKFSVNKCKILEINNPFLQKVEMKMGNETLENVNSYKYLGID